MEPQELGRQRAQPARQRAVRRRQDQAVEDHVGTGRRFWTANAPLLGPEHARETVWRPSRIGAAACPRAGLKLDGRARFGQVRLAPVDGVPGPASRTCRRQAVVQAEVRWNAGAALPPVLSNAFARQHLDRFGQDAAVHAWASRRLRACSAGWRNFRPSRQAFGWAIRSTTGSPASRIELANLCWLQPADAFPVVKPSRRRDQPL